MGAKVDQQTAQGAPPAQANDAPADAFQIDNPDSLLAPSDGAVGYFEQPGKELGLITKQSMDPDSDPDVRDGGEAETPDTVPNVPEVPEVGESADAPEEGEPAEETPDAVEEHAEDGAQPEDDGGARLVERIRTSGFDERTRRALDFLARNRDDAPTLEQALAYVDKRYPDLAVPQERAQEARDAGGDSGVASQDGGGMTLEAMDARIAQIRQEMEQPSGAFDLATYHKLNLEMVDLVRQATEARVEARLAAERESQGQEQREEMAAREALSTYPDAADASHPLNAAIRLEIDRLERVNRGFFDDPDWRLTVAAKCAARLGIAPAAPSGDGDGSKQRQAPARQQQPQAPRVPGGNGVAGATGQQRPRVQAPVPARVHGPSAAAARAAAPMSGQSIVEAAQSAPLDDVWEFLRINGSRPAPQ